MINCVLGCDVFQKEKSVSKVLAGLLEPFALPKHKRADVSMDFIMDLPVSNEGYGGILTVTDRATKMIRLVPVK